MRTIEFRGKTKDTPRKWVYGNHYGSGRESLELFWMDVADGIIDLETVEMFTGRYDNKRTEKYPEGQKIYDGDLVTGHNLPQKTPFLIEWDDDIPGFLFPYSYSEKELKVIGNITENPELINE